VNDVHDVPALAPWPVIDERDVKGHKGIDGHTKPPCRLFAVQEPTERNIGFKGRFRGHGV